jgi:hypothetical protein
MLLGIYVSPGKACPLALTRGTLLGGVRDHTLLSTESNGYRSGVQKELVELLSKAVRDFRF